MEADRQAVHGSLTVTDTASADVVEHAPDGIAVIDAEGRFVEANPAAVQLCGLAPDAVAGATSPFQVPDDLTTTARSGDLTVEWTPAPGVRREFAYVLSQVPGRPRWVVSFRDVTVSRLHQRRLAAIAKAASSVASKRSLVGTLEALAQEVARTDALAGVQVLTVNSAGNRLHVMGASGFRSSEFFDKLMECRARGARLIMLEALEKREPMVVANRYQQTMTDPAWEPLRELMRQPRWDWFASVPLLARGEPVGILNAFFAPGQTVGETELEFLLAMAEQAAMAVDHAELLERERDLVRREERQKLARDLHDSVVQQVFSMMMQARSLGVLVGRGLQPAPEKVAQVADDLSSTAEDVLADLRGMVVELRPATTAGRGLVSALHSLVDTTVARAGLAVSLDVDDPAAEVDALDTDLVEDVYRIIAEAVHNSVKHAEGTAVRVRLAVTAHGRRRRLVADVTDDGRGLGAPVDAGQEKQAPASGFGMTVMRERAARWGGVVRVHEVSGGGTCVRLTLPLVTSLPADPVPHATGTP